MSKLKNAMLDFVPYLEKRKETSINFQQWNTSQARELMQIIILNSRTILSVNGKKLLFGHAAPT